MGGTVGAALRLTLYCFIFRLPKCGTWKIVILAVNTAIAGLMQ